MPLRYLVPALHMIDPQTRPCLLEDLPVADLPYFFRQEEEIRRSRFITTLGRACSRESALYFIDCIRHEFPDATHNCWAYAVGAPADTAQVGQSDDGEPHGTAGRPMLTQLLHGGVGEVVAVTSRYFGGIKLGTGGLVRAYQGGVGNALRLLPLVEKIVPARLHVIIDYSWLQHFYRLLPAFQGQIRTEIFTADAEFVVELPDDKTASFSAALQEATDGGALLELDMAKAKPSP